MTFQNAVMGWMNYRKKCSCWQRIWIWGWSWDRSKGKLMNSQRGKIIKYWMPSLINFSSSTSKSEKNCKCTWKIQGMVLLRMTMITHHSLLKNYTLPTVWAVLPNTDPTQAEESTLNPNTNIVYKNLWSKWNIRCMFGELIESVIIELLINFRNYQ